MSQPNIFWSIIIAIVVGVVFICLVPESWLIWLGSRHSWDWIILLVLGVVLLMFIALFAYCFVTDPVIPGKMFPRKRTKGNE